MRTLLVLAVALLSSLAGAQTFVQCVPGAIGGSANILTISITTTLGHGLFASFRESSDDTTTWTVDDSSGTNVWTQSAAGYSRLTGNADSMDARTVPNAAAVTSVSAHFSATVGGTGIVCEFAGTASSGIVDTSVNSLINSFVTTLTSGTYTTTNANDVLIYCVGTTGNVTSFTAGVGFTIPAGGTAGTTRQACQYKIVSSTQAAQTTVMTWGSADKAVSVFAALKGPIVVTGSRHAIVF